MSNQNQNALSTKVLRGYKNKNPNTEYELVAEVKLMPETKKEIKKIIKKADISLKHFWVPVSFDSNLNSNKLGFIDIINDNY